MNKWIWSIALKNAVAIICWTFLAYHFGKWWIALFGAMFLTSVEWGGKTMTNALILGMLGLLMNGNAAEHPWWFWVTWWLALFVYYVELKNRR